MEANNIKNTITKLERSNLNLKKTIKYQTGIMSKDGKELARLLYKDLLVRYNGFLAPKVASVRKFIYF